MAKHCLAHCGAVRSTPSHCRYAGPACYARSAGPAASQEARLQAIAALNQRCKAPRDCQELAMLFGRYHQDALDARTLPAEALLDMLQHFDIYRRPERFEHFIAACEMTARQTAPRNPYPRSTTCGRRRKQLVTSRSNRCWNKATRAPSWARHSPLPDSRHWGGIASRMRITASQAQRGGWARTSSGA